MDPSLPERTTARPRAADSAEHTPHAPGAAATSHRRRALSAACRSIVAELSTPELRQRIVNAARETAGARSATLGLFAPNGTLESLIHSGTPTEAPAPDITEPASPSSARFLSVPLHAHGSVYGNLYLTDRVGGAFTDEDEDLVTELAATAGIALENARAYGEYRARQEWLLASREISQRLLATSRDEVEVWQLIAVNVLHLADAHLVYLVVAADDDPAAMRIVVAAGTGDYQLRGATYPRQGSLAWRAMQEGRGIVVTSNEQHNSQLLLDPDSPMGPAMALPLQGESGSRGVIVVLRLATAEPFTSADVRMAEDFAMHAALALELSDARSAAQRLGALEDRERIARDLHDHVIQRLFATGLNVQSAAATMRDSIVKDRLAQAVTDLDETIRQIRTSIFALKDPGSRSSSVRATVLAVLDEMAPLLGFRPATHFSGPLDHLVNEGLVADVAAVLRDTLTNVARHARATSARVRVVANGERFTVVIADDGWGSSDNSYPSNWADLRDRAERYGGELACEHPSGEGSRLTWSIPMK